VAKTKNSPFKAGLFRHYFTLPDIFVARFGAQLGRRTMAAEGVLHRTLADKRQRYGLWHGISKIRSDAASLSCAM
jgi:hypothetical protein